MGAGVGWIHSAHLATASPFLTLFISHSPISTTHSSSLMISYPSYTLIHRLSYHYSLLLNISRLTTTRFLYVYHVHSRKSKSHLLVGFHLPHHTFCIFKAFEWCGANFKDPCSCNMGFCHERAPVPPSAYSTCTHIPRSGGGHCPNPPWSLSICFGAAPEIWSTW